MGTPSSTKRAERETQWRERLQRYAASGQSVAAFCRGESVSDASFYLWKARLDAADRSPQAQQSGLPPPEAFIELGSMQGAGKAVAARRTAQLNAGTDTGVEIRIDLGHGMSLHIVRR